VIHALRNVGGGLAASLLSLAYCFSYGAIIFSGPLEPFLSQGVASALITAAVTAIVVALASGFKFAVAGPDSNTTALLAAMMVILHPTMVAMPPELALVLGLAALASAALLTGVALFLLGWQRLGRLIRFIPFPVVAGFLASTGWLLLTGAAFTEKIFGWHGMGEWFVDSVSTNDVNVVVAVTLFTAVLVLIATPAAHDDSTASQGSWMKMFVPYKEDLRGATRPPAVTANSHGGAASRGKPGFAP